MITKVLIANDDKKVLKKIIEVITTLDNIKIIKAESYQETLKALHEIKDIKKVILDITMPTYKIKRHDDGGTPRRRAGIDILHKVEMYNIPVSILLLTRLDQFYNSQDISKIDFSSIEKEIKRKKWKSCTSILKFEDNLNLDWKKNIIDFIKDKNE